MWVPHHMVPSTLVVLQSGQQAQGCQQHVQESSSSSSSFLYCKQDLSRVEIWNIFVFNSLLLTAWKKLSL